jgi:hypothetical protein
MLRIAGSTPHHVRDTIMRFFTASRVNVENVDAQNFGKSERRHHQQRHRKRGRRRTRQDQISLGLKIAGEIADLGSAPNEENLFLLPDRFSRRANPSEIRSSRLT